MNARVNMQNKLLLLPSAILLLLRATPKLSILFLALIILQGLLPTANVAIGMYLVDDIAEKTDTGLVFLALLWGITLVAPAMLTPVVNVLQNILNTRSTWLTQQKIINAACEIDDLKYMESADIHNNLEMLSQQAGYQPLNLLVGLVTIFRSALTALGLALVLFSVVWWLPLAFLLPMLPMTRSVARANMLLFNKLFNNGINIRKVNYFVSALLDVKLLKEIRLFNLSPFFKAKHAASTHALEQELNQVRRQALAGPLLWNLLYLGCVLAAILWFVKHLAAGSVSVGVLLGTLQSIAIFNVSCQGIVYALANVGECLEFVARLKALETAAAGQIKTFRIATAPDIQEIRFENVSFAYHTGEPVLENINLRLRAGDRLALVGENGAGKSSLIKLLCRLYSPTSGRITCNGIDIADIDIQRWREQLSAIFQDFGHYALTVRENVAFSDSAEADEAFYQACRRAKFLPGAGIQPETQLDKAYDGTELSGGQWQRLALARALYAGGQLIIFDEPTSALDPRVEAELFAQFNNLAQGKTAVIVTHRLGVVKHATRVAVLKAGKIVEQGTPTELEQLRGEYYALLTLQREQYNRDERPGDEEEQRHAAPDF